MSTYESNLEFQKLTKELAILDEGFLTSKCADYLCELRDRVIKMGAEEKDLRQKQNLMELASLCNDTNWAIREIFFKEIDDGNTT